MATNSQEVGRLSQGWCTASSWRAWETAHSDSHTDAEPSAQMVSAASTGFEQHGGVMIRPE